MRGLGTAACVFSILTAAGEAGYTTRYVDFRSFIDKLIIEISALYEGSGSPAVAKLQPSICWELWFRSRW